jgi:predicted nucleic acid-binding Zn ribbon protein
VRRAAPRALEQALDGVLPRLRPATTLARVQAAWPRVVGEPLAAEAEPVSEHAGTVTVRCASSVWAQELDLLSTDLLARLNAALAGPADGTPIESLRFVAGGRRAAR